MRMRVNTVTFLLLLSRRMLGGYRIVCQKTKRNDMLSLAEKENLILRSLTRISECAH